MRAFNRRQVAVSSSSPTQPPTRAASSVAAALALCAALCSCVSPGAAKAPPSPPLRLSGMFSGAPILQRGVPVPVWGWGEAGRRVAVKFAGAETIATADGSGRWEAVIPEMEASAEGRELVIEYADAAAVKKTKGAPERIVVADVVVGDVWYCSGQSNMEFGINGADDRETVLDDVDDPSLRLFMIPKDATPTERAEPLSGSWKPSSASAAMAGGWGGFSAVALAYGRKLLRETGVPQGLIQAAYGGSPIDAWIPYEELKATEGLERYAAQISNADKKWAKAREADPNAPHPWSPINSYAKLKPGTCHNAMLAPVAPYALRGVLWYQGESDVGKGAIYTKEMEALFAAMRRLFRNPSLAFYFAQIAPWTYGDGAAGRSLPGLWKAQYAALSMPNAAMALTVDLGDAGDIHPRRKIPVGERLALFALRDVYGKAVDAEGPVFAGARAEEGGKRIVVSFACAEGGLRIADGADGLRGFLVAGADGAFVSAEARIGPMEGKLATVVLEPPRPVAAGTIRYAWANVPEAGLADSGGLPARPFEEDFR